MWQVNENEIIGNRQALQHSITKELCLFGKHGEIYPCDNQYKAIVKGNLKSKVAEFLNISTNIGTRECELLVKFCDDKLEDMIQILKVPKSGQRQLEIANEKSA